MDAALTSASPATTSVADYCDPPPFTVAARDHSFTFYPGGADRLKALLDLIGETRQSLQLCYYLFDRDASGTLVRDALVAAAARGVAVHLIVDDFGNDAGAAFFEPLTKAGGAFDLFSPRWSTRYLVRNHQKLVIVDGARVMTGGRTFPIIISARPPTMAGAICRWLSKARWCGSFPAGSIC